MELLRAVHLEDKANAYARTLSGGMKRRLLVAKALVPRPRVVFLDEPTAGVDVALRRELWAYVRQLRAEGTTIVLTTHYLEEAEVLADRVAVIDHGSLVCVETPAALLAAHGHKRVHFTLAEPLSMAAIPPRLREVGATLDASGRLLTCPVPTQGLDGLLQQVSALPSRVIDVRTEQPTLEQVFLTLTGHALEATP